MLDEMRINDVPLNASDIRHLENTDEMAHFFAKLRYDVDERINLSGYAVLGSGCQSAGCRGRGDHGRRGNARHPQQSGQ